MVDVNCIPTSPKFINITGKKFGRLTVIEFAGRQKTQLVWKCRCECGRECRKFGTQLKHRDRRDCGCERERAGEFKKAYPQEYRHWRSMRNRCLNKNSDGWPRYGGAGVTICSEWDSFPKFIADMGPMPSDRHQIDRISSGGNYCARNCRWATAKEQCNNRRSNKLLTIDGVTKTMQQWCDGANISKGIVSKRIKRGWAAKDAVYTVSLRHS